MHLVSYIDTQIARVTPLSVARIFGGLLPRLCSFMLIKIALDLFLLNEKESSLVPGPKEVTKKNSAVPLAGKLNKFSSRGTSAGKLKNPLRFSTQVFRPIEFSLMVG